MVHCNLPIDLEMCGRVLTTSFNIILTNPVNVQRFQRNGVLLSKHQELSVLCDKQRYHRECVTNFYNLGVNIVLICVTSQSDCSDRTLRNTSVTAIKFCNTNSRVESFNAQFEVGL